MCCAHTHIHTLSHCPQSRQKRTNWLQIARRSFHPRCSAEHRGGGRLNKCQSGVYYIDIAGLSVCVFFSRPSTRLQVSRILYIWWRTHSDLCVFRAHMERTSLSEKTTVSAALDSRKTHDGKRKCKYLIFIAHTPPPYICICANMYSIDAYGGARFLRSTLSAAWSVYSNVCTFDRGSIYLTHPIILVIVSYLVQSFEKYTM